MRDYLNGIITGYKQIQKLFESYFDKADKILNWLNDFIDLQLDFYETYIIMYKSNTAKNFKIIPNKYFRKGLSVAYSSCKTFIQEFISENSFYEDQKYKDIYLYIDKKYYKLCKKELN